MKIFISGASGLIGSNCMNYFSALGHEVMGTYYSYQTRDTHFFDTLDLSNKLNADIRAFAPDVIVHCGALTHVDYCESHPDESFNKTVQSTINLLELCNELGAMMVYLSTDYVFDGLHGPYIETDALNPLSVYAKHKLQAEDLVKNYSAHLVLRVTNVYGHEERNKNFVSRIVAQCLAKTGLDLTLPFDQYATPVNAFDVARAMLLLLEDGHRGVFHIASTDYVNRVELALRVLKHFPDATFRLHTVDTASLAQPAPRPLRGGLLKTKFSSLYPRFLFSTVDDFVKQFLD